MAKTPAAIIIDQDVQARFDMKQVVRASGLTVGAESGYGQEAVNIAGDARPDVIVIGVNEPMERSLQTIEALLSLLPETPVIVYSDSRELDVARKAMLAGARDFLPRPVRPEVLRDSVLKAMEAEENRRLRRSGQLAGTAATGTIITVFGAKGGIGKSTVSTNLAVALAQQGASVVIVDLDSGFGDVAGMLDVKVERTLADFTRDIDHINRDEVKRYLVRHDQSGLDVLAGPGVLEWRKVNVDDLRRVIEMLSRTYDKVVLDTCGMLNDVSEMAMDVATMVLWVTTTEFASVRDSIEAMRALAALSFPSERVRVLVNVISPDENVRPVTVQEVLQKEIFWQVPYDKRVRQGTHLGQPIVVTAPQSVAARSFVDLATVISGGRLERNKKASGPFGWLGKAGSGASEPASTQPAASEG